MRTERGQGTVEYLAVVLLVAIVLGGSSAAVAQAAGAGIATAVPHEVLRAICIVTRGDCDRDRAPCDVASVTDKNGWSATIAIVRLGHDRILIRRRRSDGSEVITLTKAESLGLEAVDGTGVKIDRERRRRLTLGASIVASAVGTLSSGRTWIVPAGAPAGPLVAAIRDGDAHRPPDQTIRQGDLVAGLTASRDAGASLAGASANGTITARVSAGRATDESAGGATYFLEGGADAVLSASATLGTLNAAATASGGTTARIALTKAADGHWTDLAVVSTAEAEGTISLPPDARPIADALNVPGGAARRWVVEAHLNLGDAANLAAAQALVARLRGIDPAGVAAAAGDLARRIDDDAVIDVRTYALDSDSTGFDIHAGKGAGLGLGHEHTTEQTRLIAATTRGLDGRWKPRTDCLKEEHA